MKIIFIFAIMFNFYALSEDLDSLKVNSKADSWKMSVFPFAYNIPSLGQFNNNKPFKGLSLMAMKFYWYKEFNEAKDNEKISERNRAFWWFLFLYFYSIIDAYMDSQMDEFPEKMNINKEEE